MALLIFAIVLCAFTAISLRGGLVAPRGHESRHVAAYRVTGHTNPR